MSVGRRSIRELVIVQRGGVKVPTRDKSNTRVSTHKTENTTYLCERLELLQMLACTSTRGLVVALKELC